MKRITKGDVTFFILFLSLSLIFCMLFKINFFDSMISVMVSFIISLLLYVSVAYFSQYKEAENLKDIRSALDLANKLDIELCTFINQGEGNLTGEEYESMMDQLINLENKYKKAK